ncbi:hypothetical protein [uncultured Mitsuokella sp.]|nr:hypothetical protein [uncultured Mitsuokella sp.]
MKYAVGFGEWISEPTGDERLDKYGMTLGELIREYSESVCRRATIE